MIQILWIVLMDSRWPRVLNYHGVGHSFDVVFLRQNMFGCTTDNAVAAGSTELNMTRWESEPGTGRWDPVPESEMASEEPQQQGDEALEPGSPSGESLESGELREPRSPSMESLESGELREPRSPSLESLESGELRAPGSPSGESLESGELREPASSSGESLESGELPGPLSPREDCIACYRFHSLGTVFGAPRLAE